MRTLATVKGDMIRIARHALLALFLIPLLTLLFTWHMQKSYDRSLLNAVAMHLNSNPATDERRGYIHSFLDATPPSKSCATTDPDYAAYRNEYCEPWSAFWQFHQVVNITQIVLYASLALTVSILALGWLAFKGRAAQYRSLVISWRMLTWGSACIVLVQSALVVWLSFWVTAFFFEVYFVKLIAAFGIIAALGVVTALVRIFTPIHSDLQVLGEPVSQEQAPALWARIRSLAAQVGTAAPHHIVAGIDANFYVTEGEMKVQDQVLTGRSLYVSLPLLRVLDQREADAVLAHELAHLAGGDTSSGAALGPTLAKFDTYCDAMRTGGLTFVTYHLMLFYRTMFQLALMQASREREFLADRTAVHCVASLPLVRALIKVAAYSSYRGRIEQALFERSERHDHCIGIAASVAQGLQPFAHSPEFQALMSEASVPHPFDSHPKLAERMENVQCAIHETEFGHIVGEPVNLTWASEILDGDALEQRLWTIYEAHFAEVHEQNLAYRYLPATDAERELVLKHFPPLDFALDQGRQFTVSYDGLALSDEQAQFGWADVKAVEYEDGFGSDTLKLTLTEKGLLGSRTAKVNLPGIRPQRDALKAALGQYWRRHKIATGEA